MLSQPSVGDIISKSIHECRSDWRSLIRISIHPTLFDILGVVLLMIGINNFGQNIEESTLPSLSVIIISTILLVSGMLFSLPAKFVLMLRQLSWARSRIVYGETYPVALEFVRTRMLLIVGAIGLAYTVFFTSLAIAGMITGLSIALLSSGGVGPLGTFFATISIMLLNLFFLFLCCSTFVFLLAALAFGNKAFSSSLASSVSYVMQNKGVALGFMLLLIVVNLALQASVSSGLQILYVIQQVSSSDLLTGEEQSLGFAFLLDILASIWNLIVSMVLVPVNYLACGLIYQRLRDKQEGGELMKEIDLLKEVAGTKAVS